MTSEAILELARTIRNTLAADKLSPLQAKLYSQRVRRDMGTEGLASFNAGELNARLDEAMLLLETAWLERKAGADLGWRQALKRAAEVLEWISQSSIRPSGTPTHLLSAAAYQLAGYPAMALGHLRQMPADEPLSEMLRSFLRGDFANALKEVQNFWASQHTIAAEYSELHGVPFDLEMTTVCHVVMCIGTICSYLRTGETALVTRAIDKLDALAQSFLHSRDPYSYLLARLSAGAAREFVGASLWPHVDRLSDGASTLTRAALVQFARAAFVNRRALVWPAQRDGIARLAGGESFVLCTPTGSGKTTVATLGAVQGLFTARNDPLSPENIVLYLVPSRALAAEVETRFAEDLRGIAAQPVVVTGLYGGNDWGPTDAWIQIDRPAIVICTFEKADALIRYLGTLFLDRLRLVVIDEAHMVEQDPNRPSGIADGTSRSLRLEQLTTRLLRAKQEKGFRLIALSAVAAKAAPAIASWLSDDGDIGPIRSTYRSTRQMLGHLQVNPAGQFEIRYDLMDGRSLEFEDERPDDRPYVPRPFSSVPGGIDPSLGVEVRMRAPTLWAALHLAAERPDGTRPTVMISLTQSVSSFAETCADLIEKWAEEEELPEYRAPHEDDPHWLSCLAAAEDYFTRDSSEYRLLARGIAVHHGQMPALLARRLKVAIDRGNVRVVIATSTLSEGVNIPVNTLLIPSVHRSNNLLTVNEFSNLIGRAGRPGVATEGSALVVLPEREYERQRGRLRPTYNRTWEGYETLVGQFKEATALAGASEAPGEEAEAHSALAILLGLLRDAWADLTGSDDDDDFADWLEATAVAKGDDANEDTDQLLDTLDGLLIAAIQEVEQLRAAELSAPELEVELLSIWRRTYAYVASEEEDHLAQIWLGRGRAILFHYPEDYRRRQLYKTSLPPRSGSMLLDRANDIRHALQRGGIYAELDAEAQFIFIRDIVARLAEVPAFRISTKLGRKRTPFEDWEKLLRWWLNKKSLKRQPTPKELATWFGYVSDNFIYRGNWGLGSLIGVLLDRGDSEGPVDALTIDDWPRSGLPWIAFWLKELLNWGTLDPVAAFLLARGNALNRPKAEAEARDYYDSLDVHIDANDMLDPRRIRDWVQSRNSSPAKSSGIADIVLKSVLERPAEVYLSPTLAVFAVEAKTSLMWIDPAGYMVARSDMPEGWRDLSSRYSFELSVRTRTVKGIAYLPHRED
ncbi:DEAD/DEAH box helicase [Sinorhizobium meliloti]|uniref:DEAD/DEAH box helicase n=1 Tax=Rhizobium meliloti TaxID=382 RepID=UPI000FD86145|nr:DEAD/DEAH box helicase [Sinorhizobium meliloti]RVM06130.1 DEAD/DEAH box helicase [Sinorhizobium meliloti]RVO23702.1 DEAD/DEAH box helicase [Sinorhizobium meliloti]RVO49980.1 DEAD/DEAH box helicase [Sinorhizobium meliloti]